MITGGSETRFAAMCALSWSNFATSCSRPMKLLHYVSQAPHTNICNSIMHNSQCNKGQARAQNFFSPISINLVPKVV